MRAEQFNNLPTQERKAQAERRGEGLALVLHSNSDIYHAEIIDPLRIDKLLRAKTITKSQHKNGKKLFILHTLVERSFFPAVRYDDPGLRGMDARSRNAVEEKNLIRLSAQDVFYDVLTYLRAHKSIRFIRLVVLEEASVYAAAKQLRIKEKNAVRSFHQALRHLADAFEVAKNKEEALQKLLDLVG